MNELSIIDKQKILFTDLLTFKEELELEFEHKSVRGWFDSNGSNYRNIVERAMSLFPTVIFPYDLAAGSSLYSPCETMLKDVKKIIIKLKPFMSHSDNRQSSSQQINFCPQITNIASSNSQSSSKNTIIIDFDQEFELKLKEVAKKTDHPKNHSVKEFMSLVKENLPVGLSLAKEIFKLV